MTAFVSIVTAQYGEPVVHFADCPHAGRALARGREFEAPSIPAAVRLVANELPVELFYGAVPRACSYCIRRSQRECPSHWERCSGLRAGA